MRKQQRMKKIAIVLTAVVLGTTGATIRAEAKSDTYVGDYMKLITSLASDYTGTTVYNLNTSTIRYCYTSAYTYDKSGRQIDYDNCSGPKSSGGVSTYYYNRDEICAKVKGYGSIRKTDSSTSLLLEKHTTILE